MAAENDDDPGSDRARDRHRGEGHDPIGSTLTATGRLDHVLALFLLGVTVPQHSEFRTEVNVMENRSQLDTEPEEEVVPLEDATRLTKGNTNSSVENKRSPYGA
ncbi:albusnodin family lasso peptide [Streptomyces sp. NPDC002490]|uniref:albusnodin family lasso peptide n=1 Tax=Streptomyces sp. NPDC002490 TaxID=3154416 RepID=UPI00332605E5